MRPDVHLTEWSTRRLHSVDHNSFFSVGEVIMAPVQKCTRNTKIAQFLQQLVMCSVAAAVVDWQVLARKALLVARAPPFSLSIFLVSLPYQCLLFPSETLLYHFHLFLTFFFFGSDEPSPSPFCFIVLPSFSHAFFWTSSPITLSSSVFL